MAEQPNSCMKCGSRTIRGFAADHSDQRFFKLAWVDGEPVQAKLLGITGANVQLGNAEKRIVRGLRCEKCGYLELYAV